MKNSSFLFLLLFIFNSNFSRAQTCVAATGLKHGPGSSQFVRSGINNQLIMGGVYYTSTQSYFAIGNDTLRPAPNDLETIYAVVMDTAFNVIRMFNVIGFNNTGGAFNDLRIWGMHVDEHNQVYFCGSYTQDTLVAGTDTVYSDGYQEGFIVRCDSMGNANLLKSCGTRTFGTPFTYEDRATAITTDAQDNIYFVVNGEGNYFTINGDTVNGSANGGLSYSDIYTVSLDANGQTRWLKNCGTPMRDDAAFDIEADSAGNVSLTGNVNGSNTVLHFGPFQHTYIYNQYGRHGFVARYNSNGVEQWLAPVETYYPSGPDIGAYAIGVDEQGNTYASGYFDAWAIFSGDTVKTLNYTSNYLVKYDAAGNKQWIKLGNIDTFYPYIITMDVKGDKVLIAGQDYTNQLTFGQYGLCCTYNEYAVLYDTTGRVVWLKGMKELGSTSGYFSDCALDDNGTAYVCGSYYNGQVEIYPFTVSSSPVGDYFITKFDDIAYNGVTLSIQNNGTNPLTCGTSAQLVPVTNPTGLTGITWWADNDTILLPNFGPNLYASPRMNTLYIATLAYNGCVVEDSIYIDVTPLPVNAGADTTVCEGAAWQLNGNTLISATSYSWSPSAAVDVDSINNPFFTATQSEQLLYTINAYGCTNTDTMNINVIPDPVAQYSYTGNGLTITFTNLSLGQQQFIWLFDDGTQDSVNVNPVHVYSINAIYHACLVISNSCGADTVCDSIDLTTVGIWETGNENKLTIKETATQLMLIAPSISSTTIFQVYDVTGKKMISQKVEQGINVINKSTFNNGVYLLNYFSEKESSSYRFAVVR